MALMDLFREDLIFFDIEAESREELLTNMARKLETHNLVKNSFKEAIIAREETFPTGLPTEIIKVAIPHTDTKHVLKSCITICRLKKPIDFLEMGNHSRTVAVEIVFVLALDDEKNHLQALQQLIGLFSERDRMENIRNAINQNELLQSILQGANVI